MTGLRICQLILPSFQNMYEKLQKWSHHHNKEVLHLGVAALEAFLKQVTRLFACGLCVYCMTKAKVSTMLVLSLRKEWFVLLGN